LFVIDDVQRSKAPDTRAVTTARHDGRCFLATVLTAVKTGRVTRVSSRRPSRGACFFSYDGLKRQRPSWRPTHHDGPS